MASLSKLEHDDSYCVIVVTHDLELAKAADTPISLGLSLRRNRTGSQMTASRRTT